MVATPGIAFQLLVPSSAPPSRYEVERGVDVALVERPDEQGRHEPAVLAHLVDHVVAGPGQQDVLVDPGRLVGLAHPGEEVLVGLRLPRPEAGAGPRARRAALLAVDAVVEAQLLLEVEGLVRARRVLVADDVVGAGDDAAGATGAEPRGDDLVVELLPLELQRSLLPADSAYGPPATVSVTVMRWLRTASSTLTVGQHADMDLTYPPDAEEFRTEIRGWLEENLPAGWFDEGFEMSAEERAAFNEAWPAKLYEGGWICATWPKEYGGKGLSLMEGVVLAEEFARAKAPLRADFFGDTLVGPTILQWGTEEQKQEFLPQIMQRRGALVPGLQRARLRAPTWPR